MMAPAPTGVVVKRKEDEEQGQQPVVGGVVICPNRKVMEMPHVVACRQSQQAILNHLTIMKKEGKVMPQMGVLCM